MDENENRVADQNEEKTTQENEEMTYEVDLSAEENELAGYSSSANDLSGKEGKQSITKLLDNIDENQWKISKEDYIKEKGLSEEFEKYQKEHPDSSIDDFMKEHPEVADYQQEMDKRKEEIFKETTAKVNEIINNRQNACSSLENKTRKFREKIEADIARLEEEKMMTEDEKEKARLQDEIDARRKFIAEKIGMPGEKGNKTSLEGQLASNRTYLADGVRATAINALSKKFGQELMDKHPDLIEPIKPVEKDAPSTDDSNPNKEKEEKEKDKDKEDKDKDKKDKKEKGGKSAGGAFGGYGIPTIPEEETSQKPATYSFEQLVGYDSNKPMDFLAARNILDVYLGNKDTCLGIRLDDSFKYTLLQEAKNAEIISKAMAQLDKGSALQRFVNIPMKSQLKNMLTKTLPQYAAKAALETDKSLIMNELTKAGISFDEKGFLKGKNLGDSISKIQAQFEKEQNELREKMANLDPASPEYKVLEDRYSTGVNRDFIFQRTVLSQHNLKVLGDRCTGFRLFNRRIALPSSNEKFVGLTSGITYGSLNAKYTPEPIPTNNSFLDKSMVNSLEDKTTDELNKEVKTEPVKEKENPEVKGPEI